MAGTKHLAAKFLLILIFGQAFYWASGATRKTTKAPAVEGKPGDVEKVVAERIKSTPQKQLNRYKAEAAKRLQSNLVRVLQKLSSNDKEIPPKVRTQAKAALSAVQSGKLNPVMTKKLPEIMTQASSLQGKPAEQLKAILGNIIPSASSPMKAPLQGLMDFVSANLNGVNTLLTRLLGGTVDLLGGVVKSLLSSLGGINAAINGTVDSLGALLGSLL